jgi:hypothetical protein
VPLDQRSVDFVRRQGVESAVIGAAVDPPEAGVADVG